MFNVGRHISSKIHLRKIIRSRVRREAAHRLAFLMCILLRLDIDLICSPSTPATTRQVPKCGTSNPHAAVIPCDSTSEMFVVGRRVLQADLPLHSRTIERVDLVPHRGWTSGRSQIRHKLYLTMLLDWTVERAFVRVPSTFYQ
jgi:hypothetical protein